MARKKGSKKPKGKRIKVAKARVKGRSKKRRSKIRKRGGGQYSNLFPTNRQVDSNQYWQLRAEIAGAEARVRSSLKDRKDDEVKADRKVANLEKEVKAFTTPAATTTAAQDVGTPRRRRGYASHTRGGRFSDDDREYTSTEEASSSRPVHSPPSGLQGPSYTEGPSRSPGTPWTVGSLSLSEAAATRRSARKVEGAGRVLSEQRQTPDREAGFALADDSAVQQMMSRDRTASNQKSITESSPSLSQKKKRREQYLASSPVTTGELGRGDEELE